mmetsp:Transcript_17861/g.28037  ORF Transcript_17861/g.28037 Transcript_17861/m.28037 type:complete len:723 (-) Transcript_17861:179-2347(-)
MSDVAHKGSNDDSGGDDDNLLLSHVVPPSHILSDGRFVRLPPPTAHEHSAFFERAVAAQGLISGDDDEVGKKRSKRRQGSDDDNSNNDGAKKSKKADAAFIHPLAIASARLRAKGSDELSKAINLGGLVMGGEYFGLTNVVNQRVNKNNTSSGAGGETRKDGGVKESSGATAVDGLADESILIDQRLRSNYVLQQRQSQYDNAVTVLSRHERRLSASLSVRRILDARLRALRKRWRLVAPEHGTRTVGPVRPREVVAVDVEVYDRDRLGGGNRAVDDPTAQALSQLGRIARRVPRFATMELDDDYDVKENIKSFRSKIGDVLRDLKREDDDDNITSAMDVETSDKEKEREDVCMTKAEPFAIADPTLGKIDVDFDPDKVPLLTLSLEIEKSSTGFVQRASLSTSFLKSNVQSADSVQFHPDERVIEALQHSLFCASLFESMRAEIIPPSSGIVGTLASSKKQQRSVAWLSSEMEESFLPSISEMVGQETVGGGETLQLSVIHCHEGEVKVQLDDEYSLTVKLIEAGTASAAANTDNAANGEQKQKLNEADSGSQSTSQLQTLCRTLLLHSQSLYHDHCIKTRVGKSSEVKTETNNVTGLTRKNTTSTWISPHILQSCVGLGCKLIFEMKVRMVLDRISEWLAKDMNCEEKIEVEWLPTTVFSTHSCFVILFNHLCLDVRVDSDKVRVTQMSDSAEYKSVQFGSDFELEYYLRKHIIVQLKTT